MNNIKFIILFLLGFNIYAQDAEVTAFISDANDDYVEVSITNTVVVAGFQFDIVADEQLNAVYGSINPGEVVSTWMVSGNSAGTMIGFELTGGTIAPGTHVLLQASWTHADTSGNINLELITNSFTTFDEDGNVEVADSEAGDDFLYSNDDCAGLEDGNTVCLEYNQVDQNAGSFDIEYSSLNPISGFQFNLSGISIDSAESNLGDVYVVESSGFMMCFLEEVYLPPSELATLVTVYFTPGPEMETCLSNPIITGIGGISYLVNLPECEIIPEADTDCTGEYGGDAVIDECGLCEGLEFGCDEPGYCSCSGCTDEPSCNYNETSLVDDGTCWTPNEFCNCDDGEGAEADCNNECNGMAGFDICGECDGNGWDYCDDDSNGETNYDQWGYGAYDITVEDIPEDQGYWVYVEFRASFLDETEDLRDVEIYHIEREDLIDDELEWVSVGSSAVYGQESYTVQVPTLYNATDEFEGESTFRVIASMEEDTYISNESGIGTSIDNIDPALPEDLSGGINDGVTEIFWSESPDEDLAYYIIYRNDELINYSESSSFTESGLLYYSSFTYSIQSVDIHGNTSEPSEPISFDHRTSYSLNFHDGENLASFYALPEDNSITNIMLDLGMNVTGVIGEGVAASQTSLGNWVGSLEYINPASGYWIKLVEADDLDLEGIYVGQDLEYDLHDGANLISYPIPDPIEISSALPDDVEPLFEGIIGEGIAAIQITPYVWIGSLVNFKGTDGYWAKVTEDLTFRFELSDGLVRTPENTLPESPYDYTQSIYQAFYFLEEATIDGEPLEIGDWIIAYNEDIVVGARQWTGAYTDIPAMGYFDESTLGYCEAGDIPRFVVEKGLTGEVYELDGTIPVWENNMLFYMTLQGSTVHVPTEFEVSAAYPNPFNPRTNVKYGLPVDNFVSIVVYDLSGKQVASLMNEQQTAGFHSVTWDAQNHSSGLYFVKLVTKDYQNTQKVMLVK